MGNSKQTSDGAGSSNLARQALRVFHAHSPVTQSLFYAMTRFLQLRTALLKLVEKAMHCVQLDEVLKNRLPSPSAVKCRPFQLRTRPWQS